MTITKTRLRDGLVLLGAGVIALGIAGSWGVHRVPASVRARARWNGTNKNPSTVIASASTQAPTAGIQRIS